MTLKKNILLFSFLFLFVQLNGQIKKSEILKASENYIVENSIFKGRTHKSEVIDLYSEKKLVAHLVQLRPEGYIIFASSKNIYPVFSYSEKGSFDYKNIKKNPVVKSLLVNLKKQIEASNKQEFNFKENIAKNQQKWESLLHANNLKNLNEDYQYGYYLTDIWGGVNCWDNEGNFIYPSSYYTPNHYSPGCVAISAAQILHYYEWPPVGVGSYTDYDNNGSSQGSYYARFGSMFYDWENMLNDYQGEYSTDAERRAIGRLMYHVGVAVDMDYEDLGSTSHANKVPNAFQSYFRTTGHYQSRSWSEFGNRLRTNLENGMPVEFGVKADNGDEHACVCDGYRYNEGDAETDKFYHLNMGWWNWYGGNAWYKIFDDFNAVGYTSITGGVFDVLPKPMMNKVQRSSDYHEFTVSWHVSKNLKWDAFELQESFNNGTWATIDNNITDTLYVKTVTTNGIYKYRVRAKVGGAYYADSYSNVGVVQVGETIFLDFDGDDSFFVNDSYENLDVSDNWTYEAWVKVNSYNNGDWSVIMDRQTVFSLYLVDDANADFALRFVSRDASGNILSSLISDNSDVNLEFGKWFHVAVSRDGTTARLFLNGKLIEESTDANFVLASSTKALNVGARYWGSYSRYLDGQIDEIRLSSKARYTEEFCPSRFEVFENDNDTRLLLNLQYGTGTGLFDASRKFLGISLRSSPHTPNWATEETPIINIQPKSKALCSGSISFEINTENTDNYQWQINSGSDFTNFVDNGNVTGATSNTLQINNVSAFGEDNIVRCILSNSTVPHTCSQDALFSVYENCTIWDGTTWSNGTPNATKSAIINANYTANDFLTTDNLTINEDDTLFLNEDYTLIVNGDFINNGTLILKSENANAIPGTFIQNGELINYGSIISKKALEAINSNPSENIYLFSNPTINAKKVSNTLSNSYIFKNNGNINAWEQLTNNENIKPNEGYLIQNNNDEILSIKANLKNGSNETTLKTLSGNDAFSVLANPYPSCINWNSTSGWQKQNLSSTLYTYDVFNSGNSFNFSIWDGEVGIHNGSGIIKPMEAYIVYLNDFRANISTNNDVRISTADINSNKTTPNNLIKFKFETDDETIYDEAIIYFGDTEKNILKIQPLSDNKFYTFIKNGSSKLAIKKFNKLQPDTIASVGFKSPQAQQIKFEVTDFTFDLSIPVQLKDLWTGEYTSLQLGTIYTFDASSSEPDNRFKIYFGSYVVPVKNINNENLIKVWATEDNIFIKNLTYKTFNFQLYDVSGKLISEGSSNNELTNIKNIHSGIKILKITSPEFLATYKLNIVK